MEGGVNPYGYVHNPLSWVDPLGLANYDANKKTTYEGENRRDSFRQAKRDADVPMSQQPDKITRAILDDGYGNKVIGKNGQPVTTREYHFTNKNSEHVVIQEHSLGHAKATPMHGADPHFNIRQVDPITGEVLNTSSFPNTHGHYNFP